MHIGMFLNYTDAPPDYMCAECHPDNAGQGKAAVDNGSVKAYPHASDGTNVLPANVSNAKGNLGQGSSSIYKLIYDDSTGQCTKNCHFKSDPPRSWYIEAVIVAPYVSSGSYVQGTVSITVEVTTFGTTAASANVSIDGGAPNSMTDMGPANDPYAVGTAEYYQSQWDTTTLINGSHTIAVTATDTDGHTPGPVSLTVTVTN